MDQPRQLSDSARHVLVYVNPMAGAWSTKQAVERLTNQLSTLDFTWEVINSPAELGTLADKHHNSGELRTVVSAGGDGTAALVLSSTAPTTPVALLPQGTENLLSRYLRSPRSPEAVAQMIAEGCFVKLDAGEANGQLFTLMVSCGFDAEVVRLLSESRRGNISHLSYCKPMLSALRNYKYPEIRIHSAGSREVSDAQPSDAAGSDPLTARWAVVTNAPLYAMGLCFAPGARSDDGLLDVTAYRYGNWHSMVRYYTAALLGMDPQRLSARSETGASFRLESDGKVPYQLDGDPGGFLPVDIKVLPQRLTMVVTRTAANQLPIGKPFETEPSH